MSNTATNHPSKEELCEYALHESDEVLFTHIEKCNSCSEYVDDIKNISHDISAVEEEEVPERTEARILAIARCKRKCRGEQLGKEVSFHVLPKFSYHSLLICSEVYRQQEHMYSRVIHRISDRIVSIAQPHVRPIVRGKAGKKVEFGAKKMFVGSYQQFYHSIGFSVESVLEIWSKNWKYSLFSF